MQVSHNCKYTPHMYERCIVHGNICDRICDLQIFLNHAINAVIA